MNKFSRKPLALVLNYSIQVAWIGLILIACSVILLFIFRKGETFTAINVPVKMEEAFIRKIQSTDIQKSYMIIAHEGNFKMRIESGWKNKILICLMAITLFAGLMTVIYQVKNIFKSFSRDEPFDEKNLRRIRIIAFMFIGFFIGKNIFIIIMERYLTNIIQFENIRLGYDNGTVFLCLGLAMLTLEAAFKRGVVLEEDEQLTI